MDEQIKRLAQTLQLEYGLFILLSLLLFIAYELNWLPVGYYADNARMQYILGTISILTTISLVPLSLKLFNIALVKKIKDVPLPKALKLYNSYSNIRLGMLVIVVLINIIFYYFTLQSIGGLCALIGITASIFCLPGENKIREELDLNKIEKE